MVPEHRGHGYGHDVLQAATSAAHGWGLEEILSDFDTLNLPDDRSRGSGSKSSPNHRTAQRPPGCRDYPKMTGHQRDGFWRDAGYLPPPTTPDGSPACIGCCTHTCAPARAVTSEQRLDTHLQRVSHELVDAAAPDTALLAVTAATLTTRLAEGRHQLADSALWLINRVRERLDSATTGNLATATLDISERLAAADPDNPDYQRNLSASLLRVGKVRVARGDPEGALQAYTRALQIAERLAGADPDNPDYQRNLAVSLNRVGKVRVARGDPEC